MGQLMKKKPRVSMFDRLVERLRKFGMTERKAKEVAKGLVPTVRSTVKAEEKQKSADSAKPKNARKGKDELVDEGQDPDDETNTPVGAKAVKVNGHTLRLDLPVVPYQGEQGLSLLRVMHGLSSTATYLVAAVLGPEGIVAIRKLSEDCYNVKFYPDMRHWNYSASTLADLGATSHLKRQPYERMHFTADGVDQLLRRIDAASKKNRFKTLAKRLLALTFKPLSKAFDVLYKRVSSGGYAASA
jgi:hypothetical protein